MAMHCLLVDPLDFRLLEMRKERPFGPLIFIDVFTYPRGYRP